MALTAPAQLNTKNPDHSGQFPVASGVTIYKGAMVGVTEGTGTLTNYGDDPRVIFVGYMTGPGNSAVGVAALTVYAEVSLRGDVLQSTTVTGTTAATDNFQAVYMTDENTFTLTRPADDALPVGVVLRWRTGTTVDVLLLSCHAALALSLAGGNKRRLFISSVHTSALEGTSATDLVTSFTLWGHGKIVDFVAIANGFDASYAAGNAVINLEIGGTNVTGGVLTLNSTGIDSQADKALVKSATAITAANTFSDADLLDIELATDGTAFTVGVSNLIAYDLFIDVEYLAGN